MINPERKPNFSELKEKLDKSAETRPKTDLQKDHSRIISLMNDLENPAPGMDKKLAQDTKYLYNKLDIPEGASLETIKIAYGQAVSAEKTMNASEAAREAFKNAGIESPHRIARVAIEYNVLADEVGDLQEAKISKTDMSEDAKTKVKQFEKINEEWNKITDVMQEYVTPKTAMGDLRPSAKTAKVVGKRAQGEKPLAGITPKR